DVDQRARHAGHQRVRADVEADPGERDRGGRELDRRARVVVDLEPQIRLDQPRPARVGGERGGTHAPRGDDRRLRGPAPAGWAPPPRPATRAGSLTPPLSSGTWPVMNGTTIGFVLTFRTDSGIT